MAEPISTPAARELLAAVLGTDDDAAMVRWRRSGVAGLRALRGDLDGSHRVAPVGDHHGREVVDRYASAIAALAEAEPDAYLSAFSAPQLRSAAGVVTGLGVIDRPAATRRLLAALEQGDRWVRLDAAIGLGNRPGDDVVEGLAAALADEEYLVRYHALRSLARVGEPTSRAALDAHAARPDVEDVERDLARAAVQIIDERARLGDDARAQIELALSIGDLAGVRRHLDDVTRWPEVAVPPDGRSLLALAEEVAERSALDALRRAARLREVEHALGDR